MNMRILKDFIIIAFYQLQEFSVALKLFLGYNYLSKINKKSNRKAERANTYLEIAKNVIEIIAFAITIIKSLGN